MKAELVPDNGDPPIPIRRDISVVGRREYCDIRIDHPTISKRHCVLIRTSGLLILRDLATTNGTKVKGQRIRWAALLPGDRVSLGGYKMRVYLGPDDAPAPSEMGPLPRLESMVGFDPPTPSISLQGLPRPPAPVPEPAAPVAAPRSEPSEDDDAILLGEDDLIGEDDSKWEKLRPTRDDGEFFIEFD